MTGILLNEWSNIFHQANSAVEAVNVLCWILAAIFGLMGSLKVYNKWQLNAHHHFPIDAEIAIWFMGALFFIIAHFAVGILFNLSGTGF